MRARLFGSGLIAALLISANASAQEAPAKPQEEGIVVTGQREVPPAVAKHYVGQISSSIDGQLTQFREPVCPLVIGFAPQYNQIVAQRIRTVAADAGVKVAGEKCRANLVLMIAKDADALVKAMRTKTPNLFAGVADADLKRAFAEGPVHVWNTTELRNEDGKAMGHSDTQGGGAFANVLDVKSASIIELPTQRAILGSMVVIDDDATLGKTLTQIADYAAMRALAGARPPQQGVETDTILTLFDPDATAPLSVTSVDRSYLQGLYDTRPTARGMSAKSRIASRIVNDAKERSGAKD
jgi:hypothetical protein